MKSALTIQTVAYILMLESVTKVYNKAVSPEVESMTIPNKGGSAMPSYVKLEEFVEIVEILDQWKEALRYVSIRCSFTSCWSAIKIYRYFSANMQIGALILEWLDRPDDKREETHKEFVNTIPDIIKVDKDIEQQRYVYGVW